MDFNISFVLGLAFALTAGPALKREAGIMNRYFWRAVLYQLLVMVPIGIYLVVRWPDWSWMYIIDPSAHPNQMWAGLCCATVGYMSALLAGYISGYLCIRINEESVAKLLMALGIIGLVLATFLPYLPRPGILWLGTTSEFRAGGAKLAVSDPAWVISFVIIGVYFFVPLAYLVRKNRKESQSASA